MLLDSAASEALTASEAEEGLVRHAREAEPAGSGRQRRLVLAAGLAGAGLVAAAWRHGEPTPAGSSSRRPDPFIGLQECAEGGVDCKDIQCCASGGMQCYRKNDEWAQCLSQCNPGEMNGKDTDGTWTCEELGTRTETTGACATKGGDCLDSQCCSMPGMQCYKKDEFWASCLETCVPAFVNDDPTDVKSWTCEELGTRTPGEVPKRVDNDDFWKPKSSKTWPPGSAANCSWPADDCTKSKCCKMNGFDCYGISEYWSSCMTECNDTTVDADGKPASCKLLGESRSNQDPLPQAVGKALATSMYCIVVAKEGSYEMKLVAKMEEESVGIFACDAHNVFHGLEAKLGEWGSVSNVDIFIDIWKQVKEEGVYEKHDWVIKVDPDAVFLPERLKGHLEGLMAPATKQGLYLKNCDYLFGFMGSLEVFTSNALDTYLQGADDCAEYFGHDGGEDFYLMTCFDALGVGHMDARLLLKDKYGYADHRPFNLTSVAHCKDDNAVAFHPHKSAERWMACYKLATEGIIPPGESLEDDQDIAEGDQAGVGAGAEAAAAAAAAAPAEGGEGDAGAEGDPGGEGGEGDAGADGGEGDAGADGGEGDAGADGGEADAGDEGGEGDPVPEGAQSDPGADGGEVDPAAEGAQSDPGAEGGEDDAGAEGDPGAEGGEGGAGAEGGEGVDGST